MRLFRPFRYGVRLISFEVELKDSQVFERGGECFVFTATSGRSRYPYIAVWAYGRKSGASRSAQKVRVSCMPKICSVIRWIAKFALVAAVAVFALLLIAVAQELDIFVGQYHRVLDVSWLKRD